MDKSLEDLRSFISDCVREGFESVHEVVENATDYAVEKFGRDDLQPAIKRMAAEALTEHRV